MTKRKQRKKGKSRKRIQHRGLAQTIVNFLAGLVLSVCLVSVGYGFLARHADASGIEVPIRIEVLNGTGHAGLASKVASELRKRGIDVFKVGNADHFDYEETILIKRRVGIDADVLADDIGCDKIVEQLLGVGFVDATLVVGRDYAALRLGIDPESSLPDHRN